MTTSHNTLQQQELERAVAAALAEDLGFLPLAKGDITASLIPPEQQASATIITREDCVVCGTAFADEVFRQLGGEVQLNWQVKDGDKVSANSVLCTMSGPARILLTGERTALNFLQLLSAVATKTVCQNRSGLSWSRPTTAGSEPSGSSVAEMKATTNTVLRPNSGRASSWAR